MRFIVVGDIHGSLSQLTALLELQDAFRNRPTVFLGDYVDVGMQSMGVIDLLLRFRASHHDTVFLKGNHDIALMEYLRTGDFGVYAVNGGIPTIRSYCGVVHGDVHASMISSVPAVHIEFLAGLENYVETPEYLFSHSGYDPAAPDVRSFEGMVLESHQTLFQGELTLPKLAVCGHYFQNTHRPFVSDRFICLDTGCGILNGPLTAMLLPERRFVQVWPDLTLTES
jgi:serine/threonine protein phosphatase 1